MEQQTIAKLTQMNIKGMSETYHEDLSTGQLGGKTITEYFARLVDAEWEYRQNRKIKNLKRAANFRQQAHPLNIDYTINRQLDKGYMQRLLSFDFMRKAENVIFTGFTGTGKSYLAQAIGTSACENEYRTAYYPMSLLSDAAGAMVIQGNYPKWITRLQKTPLLILDDFGLTEINDATRKVLMDLIDYRYAKHSTIIVSQIPVNMWHPLIGEDTIADAILDRIVHNAHRIELKGESMRRQKKIASE
ncbi:MAG: DNA replication protein DnaC [Saprospiraceae bacterium]|jgi:DNA replication protein DnaC